MQAKKLFLFVCEAFLLPLLTLMPAKSYAEGNRSVPGSTNLFAAAVISEERYIVVGDRGRIFVSDDGARTWKAIASATKQPLVSVCFPDDRNGWITGQAGVILHSADGGNSWKAQTSGVDSYLLASAFVDGKNGCVAGEDSTVLMTADGGLTWKKSGFKVASDADMEEDSGPAAGVNLFAVAMMDAMHLCVAGDKGRIFLSEDGGESWTEATSPLYDDETGQGRILYSLAYDSGTLYGVGIDGAFIHSKDRGKTWQEGSTGLTDPDLYCIGLAGGIGFAAGSEGHVIRTSDGGSTWKVVEVPEKVTQSWLSGIALKKTGIPVKPNQSGTVCGLLVGQNGTIGHLVDGDVRWQGIR